MPCSIKQRDHELYGCWASMVQRCTDPGVSNWEYYGGRGIGVCEKWRTFKGFLEDVEASIGERPDGYTLDRIDADGDYEPGNVRWASKAQQQRNRRPMKNSASGVSGVRPYQSGYRVQIGHEGRSIHIGMFKDFDGAVAARRRAEKEYWGA